jgi:hypothetical protein
MYGVNPICYTTGMSTLPNVRAHMTPRRLCSARLSFGSGLLTLFTRRTTVKTHLTRNRQLLTRGPKGVPPPQRQGSRICDHSSPIFSPISPAKTFLSRSHSRYLHPRMQNSAHHEHRAGKRMLERTESRRADRGSPKG